MSVVLFMLIQWYYPVMRAWLSVRAPCWAEASFVQRGRDVFTRCRRAGRWTLALGTSGRTEHPASRQG